MKPQQWYALHESEYAKVARLDRLLDGLEGLMLKNEWHLTPAALEALRREGIDPPKNMMITWAIDKVWAAQVEPLKQISSWLGKPSYLLR